MNGNYAAGGTNDAKMMIETDLRVRKQTVLRSGPGRGTGGCAEEKERCYTGDSPTVGLPVTSNCFLPQPGWISRQEGNIRDGGKHKNMGLLFLRFSFENVTSQMPISQKRTPAGKWGGENIRGEN